MSPTILCLASYFKGAPFVEECKRQGCHTILVTTQKLEQEAWPRQAIDEFFMLPHANLSVQPDITHAVAYLARERNIDRIIALDDYDVETAADPARAPAAAGDGALPGALLSGQAGHAGAGQQPGRAGAGLHARAQL